MALNLKKVVKTFNHTQILTMPSFSPLTLKTGEVGRILIPVAASIVLNPWAAAYTNIDGTTHTVKIDVGVGSTTWWQGTLNESSVFGVAAPQIMFWEDASPGFVNTVTDSTVSSGLFDTDGKPLQLFVANGVSGNFTGGDPTNYMTVTLWFMSQKVEYPLTTTSPSEPVRGSTY